MRERLVHGEDAPVVLRIEVLEVVHAAPREERFPRIGGIGAVERLGEEGVQSEAGVLRNVSAAQRVRGSRSRASAARRSRASGSSGASSAWRLSITSR